MEHAALSLAVAAIKPIFARLTNMAASYFGGDVTSQELDEFVNIILPKIKIVIGAGNAVNVDDLKVPLMNLKAAAYVAEDLLDEYEYFNIQNEVSPLPTTLKNLKDTVKELFGPYLLKTPLKKCMEEVRQHADKADKLVPIINMINRTTARENSVNQPSTTVSCASSPVFGRDEELESLIVKSLEGCCYGSHNNRRTNSIYVHAIRGIGAAGKTTLAQYFYNHEKVEAALNFQLKIWIHVSQTFDAFKITKEIIESLEQGESSPVGSLDVLQRRLMQRLQSNKFLLVLDDVWCDQKEKWDQFLIPFNKVQNEGSMVLITTRMGRVTKNLGIKNIHDLKELGTNDCYSIMKYYAFGAAKKKVNRNVKSEMKKIVGRSKNSPLAARIVGCSQWQSTNVNEWKKLFKEDMLQGPIDALLLSFQHLPSHLQRCFAFCSLYPRGHHFYNKDVDELVRFWISLGYVQPPVNNNLTLEDEGRKYFEELLSHSFFQVHDLLHGDEHQVYVIHDLLHELAEKVSKDEFLRIEGDGPEIIPKTIIHISISSSELVHMPNILEHKNLRTFIIFFASTDNAGAIIKIGKTISEKLRKLRVFYFGRIKMQEIFTCPSKHLRYLQASGVRELPKALGNLYHLQFLDLPNNSIREVPKSTNNLVKLRRVVGCESDNYILSVASKIDRLTSLQELQVYHASKDKDCGVGQLKNISQLRGSLHIGKLENVSNRTKATGAKLNGKRHLEELILSWSSMTKRNPKGDEEVFEGFKPHSNLEKLGVDGYQGAKLPKWWMINDEYYLAHLQTLKLKFCPHLVELPSLPCNLKTLHVMECSNLMKVDSFPDDLSELIMEGCPKLKQLPLLPCSLEDNYRISCPGIGKLMWSTFNDEEEEEEEEEQKNYEGSWPPLSLDELLMKAIELHNQRQRVLSLGPV